MPDIVDNERTKLLANALDRASTAILTIGVLAPLAAAIYSLGMPAVGAGIFIAVAIVWLLVATGLHLLARFVLGGLEQ